MEDRLTMNAFFFAQDPLDKNFCSQVLQSFTELEALQPQLKLMALINGAASPNCQTLLQAQGLSPLPVFDESPYRGLAFAGPLLVPIAPNLAALETLAQAFNGIPALSLMATSCMPLALQSHLAEALQVTFVDEQDEGYLLNLADTRCLPELLPLLCPPQGPGFSPEPAWLWYPDRQGRCQAFQQSAAVLSKAGVSSAGVSLHAAQWRSLVDSADADAVLARIHESEPELLHGRKGSSLYAMASEQIARLRADGHDDIPAFVSACHAKLSHF